MKIRTARISDLEAIVEIYNQAITAGFMTADTKTVTVSDRKNWFESHNPNRYPIFVAESEGLIVAYLSISPYRPGRMALRYTAEASYYVHVEHQRQGIASSLMKFAIGKCPSLQIKTLFAILIDNNSASIKLLEKFGFTKWGHMPQIADFDGIEVGHLYYGLRVEKT